MIRVNYRRIVWLNLVMLAFIASTEAIDFTDDFENKTTEEILETNVSFAIEINYQKRITHVNRGEFITEHNYVRKWAQPLPTDMVFMVWSLRLQKMAEEIVSYCTYKGSLNNKEFIEMSFWFSSGGLNSWEGNAEESLNVTTVVQTWSYEKRYFDFENLGCELGRKCMRYAQVVWAKASHVGCALSFCPIYLDQTQHERHNQHSVVCIYGEGETKFNKHGDYKSPYISGTESCSHCPTGFPKCIDGLCHTVPPCETVVDCIKARLGGQCLCEESVYESRGHRSIVQHWTSLEAVITLVIFMTSYG